MATQLPILGAFTRADPVEANRPGHRPRVVHDHDLGVHVHRAPAPLRATGRRARLAGDMTCEAGLERTAGEILSPQARAPPGPFQKFPDLPGSDIRDVSSDR